MISEKKELPKKEPQKQRYIIDVEGIAPVKLRLETWAYDEEEALKQLENPRLCNIVSRPEIDLPRLRRKLVRVKDAITSMIKIVRSF